jgi:hypothetical protein
VRNFHPELGYLLPTDRFLGAAGFALVAATVGAIVGGVAALALSHRADGAATPEAIAFAAITAAHATPAAPATPVTRSQPLAALEAPAAIATPEQQASPPAVVPGKPRRVARKHAREHDPRGAYASPYRLPEEVGWRDWKADGSRAQRQSRNGSRQSW